MAEPDTAIQTPERSSTPSSVEKEKQKGVAFQETSYAIDPEKRSVYGSEEDDEKVEVIRKAHDVATQV